jgi:hypothetical protein
VVATDVQRFKKAGIREAKARVEEARSGSLEAIDNRLTQVRAQSAQLQVEIEQFGQTDMTRALVTGNADAIRAHYKRKVDLEIADLETKALIQAKEQTQKSLNIAAAKASLESAIKPLNDFKLDFETKQLSERAAKAQYNRAIRNRQAYEAQYAGAMKLCREIVDSGCTPEHDELLEAEAKARTSLTSVTKARVTAENQLTLATKAAEANTSALRDAQAVVAGVRARLSEDQLTTTLQDLDAAIDKQASRWEQKVRSALLPALVIWLGAILLPVVLKMLGYFVFAPLAQKLEPVEILKGEAGELLVAGTKPRSVSDGDISKVSVPVSVGADEELLVHPDYLQSTGDAGDKGTQWLLNWRYPLTSLAAGLMVLTRIRPAPGEPVVVSSRKDPFSEVALVTIPEGSAAVLQPRCLAGVVQKRDRPLRITSHWRLGTLKAWLTWQMRFLVFHGPVTVIAKGTRGVRIEPAGSGRSINQQATIGFSAGVGYGVRRCETFMAYLRGEQALFNDTLRGGRGYYIYEEMPAPEHRKSLAGRGIEGLVDAGLKVFGV